ncbi:MAG: hypothetical protein SFU56_12005 [Capsulimonadales bacterium]|nr:hypothetical protein [Capsulimonadales bacterium]
MLVFCAIAPHGGDIIPQIADDPTVMEQTRTAMKELGRRFLAARPDTVVVATPHGIIVEGAVTISATRHAAGILGDPNAKYVKAAFDVDLEWTRLLEEEMAFQSLPFLRLVGESKRQEAILPLDWGALVPLWFTAHPMRPRPRVVILGPDRSLSREALVRCGVAIARASTASGKRVAFIASCDLGHAHDASGPYGFDETAAEHDRAFCAAIVQDRLPDLLTWPDELTESAKVDSYWQTLMLMGALGHTPMRGELLSYECPTYFGMAVASYEPVEGEADGPVPVTPFPSVTV